MHRGLPPPDLQRLSSSPRRPRKPELEGSSLSESSSRVDDSSPPRDSPSLESSDTEDDLDSAEEFRDRRQRNSRSSMPDREIDEGDTETAELQVNLRKISGRSFIPSLKLSSAERESDGEDRKCRSVSVEEAEAGASPETWRPARRSQEREAAAEREVVEEDTVTAEFQTNLRKLSSNVPVVTTANGSEPPTEVNNCQTEKASPEVAEPVLANTSTKVEEEAMVPQVSRAAPGRRKAAQNKGLQRSRTWQGFASGQRYESVSDAGLPPPPPVPAPAPAPPPQARSEGGGRARPPQGYRPLAALRPGGLERPGRPRGGGSTGAFPQSAGGRGGWGVLRSLSEGSLDTREEEVSYECLVSCSSSASSEPRTEEEMEGARGELTPAQMDHLMSVIAGMDSVKGAGGGGSPPPTDDEIRQFIDYMGHGEVNQERLDYDASRDQPEPPKRSKTAQQYFWRRHYLSIIQEDEAEEETPGSSRPSSRPCSTYENSLASRLSRLGALSPLTQGKEMDGRGSWGSEMSVDSINSILSEEGSLTSTGSFQSELVEQEVGARLAPPGLSCLLELVQPPSCTPDSMAGPPCTPDTLDRTSSCTSPNTRQEETPSTPSTPSTAAPVIKVIKPMGSKFKQQIKQIEDLKRQGKALGVGQCSGSSMVLPPPLPSTRLPPLSSEMVMRKMSPPKEPQEQQFQEMEEVRAYRAIPSSRLRKPRGRSRGRLMVEE